MPLLMDKVSLPMKLPLMKQLSADEATFADEATYL